MDSSFGCCPWIYPVQARTSQCQPQSARFATRRDGHGMALPNVGKAGWGDSGRLYGIELLTLRLLTVIFAPGTERTF